MATRRPLIVNAAANQIQELTDSDGLIGNGTIPIGGIIMWSGTIANIPTGWALCNGSNGTPDLRNKFIIAASVDDGGSAKTGVTGSNTLSGGTKDAIVVSHTHTATSTVTDPGHNHTVTVPASGKFDVQGNDLDVPTNGNGTYTTTTNTTGITVSTSISTEGSSGTNQNLPPYYALAFIMRTI